jgi:hypothetical protein
MEVPQGNSLYSYCKQAKWQFYSFTKSKNRWAELLLPVGEGGFGTSGSGEEVGKGCKRVNMMQILCTHVCKWKNDTH